MGTIRRLFLRLLSFFRSGRAEAELAREINSHLQLLEDKYLAQGMKPEEARCAARRAFGGVEQAKERQRAARSFGAPDSWWLDVKLGVRMLIRYPGLALIGGFGIAVAVAIAAGGFSIIYGTFLDPSLPLEEGDRIVSLQNWDPAAEGVEFGRWYEIVGIVGDFPAGAISDLDYKLKLYHAVAAGQVQPVTLAFRVRGSVPTAFAGRLREIAAAVAPDLQLRNILSLDESLRRDQWIRRREAAVLATVTLSVLILSSAGIYALMSFTVSQRRKEIGIRAALGADPRRIVAAIFSRALGQLAVGAMLGVIAAAPLVRATRGDLVEGNEAVILPFVVALFMIAVGFLAALGPARRGLRIQPTEVLRDE